MVHRQQCRGLLSFPAAVAAPTRLDGVELRGLRLEDGRHLYAGRRSSRGRRDVRDPPVGDERRLHRDGRRDDQRRELHHSGSDHPHEVGDDPEHADSGRLDPGLVRALERPQHEPLRGRSLGGEQRLSDDLREQHEHPDRNAARQRISDFNVALASVCAEFAPCTWDGGATHDLRFETTDLAFDFFHLSVPGQAKLAQATWDAGPFSQPPANQSPPTISGTAQVGQTLSASTGTWSGSPTSFAYQWRRCDSGGTGCADLPGAGASTYVPVGGDVGSTLRVRVTATNDAGSSSAESAPSAVVTDAPGGGVPPGFASVVTDSGCGGCSVTAITDGLQATIAGAADSSDTAYGVQELGGAGGLTGRVFVRTLLSLAQGQTLSGEPLRPADPQRLGAARVRALPRLRSQPAPVEPGRRPARELDQPLHRDRPAQRRQLPIGSRSPRSSTAP